jgi:hypothetical protein
MLLLRRAPASFNAARNPSDLPRHLTVGRSRNRDARWCGSTADPRVRESASTSGVAAATPFPVSGVSALQLIDLVGTASGVGRRTSPLRPSPRRPPRGAIRNGYP